MFRPRFAPPVAHPRRAVRAMVVPVGAARDEHPRNPRALLQDPGTGGRGWPEFRAQLHGQAFAPDPAVGRKRISRRLLILLRSCCRDGDGMGQGSQELPMSLQARPGGLALEMDDALRGIVTLGWLEADGLRAEPLGEAYATERDESIRTMLRRFAGRQAADIPGEAPQHRADGFVAL